MALVKVKYGEQEADIIQGSSPEEASGLIEFCLKTKGYCCIGQGVDEATIEQAQGEVEALDGVGKLEVQHALVQDGLLGADGSGRVADMEMTDFADDGLAPEGVALKKIDLLMWSLAKSVLSCQDRLGFEGTSRSCGFIHQSGDTGEEVELTDLQADKWSSIFLRRKVAVLVFLGPDSGTLELQPYDEEANPTEISTYPGLIVLLRTDQLDFKYESIGVSTCVTSFIMQDSILRLDPAVRQVHMTPAAEALEQWILNRLKEMKAEEDEETVWGDDVPRGFVLAMNHQWQKVSHTAVHGAAFRNPVSWLADPFFAGQLAGCDLVCEVPEDRWNHHSVYDPNPDGWKDSIPKTNCRHVSFVDGIDFFDNKMFGLAPVEAKGMDPQQRLLLECSYESLFMAGMKKGKLINSSCGLYLGITNSEWDLVERDKDQGSFAATGGHPAIACGRISFCLGLKGACLSIDTEACSGLTAISNAAESVQIKGRGRVQDLALGDCVSINMAKAWWPALSAAGMLSSTGRCLTFDQSADGYVRSDCCGAVTVRRAKEIVDGERVEDEHALLGMIYGASMCHTGTTASLHAPNGISIQECLRDTVRHADIQNYDVDAVELHGDGRYLCDAVEVGSVEKAFRNGNLHESLLVASVKTYAGNGKEAAGFQQFLKALSAGRWGVNPASNHLCQLNPHIELQDTAVNLLTEPLEFRLKSSFHDCFSRGMAGTNISVLMHGAVDQSLRPPPKPMPEELRPKLTYWPAGGGSLSGTSYPRRAYFIAGTMNGWSPQKMEDEDDGVYGFTVALGENRWEQFRILLDGEDDKTLHPNRYKAPKGTMVFGPEEVEADTSWLIDGRTQYTTFESVAGDGAQSYEFEEYSSADQGTPGTEYRVRLYVAGKWRTVSWTKLESKKELADSDRGKYYIIGDWNQWSMHDAIEMEADSSKPGTYTGVIPRSLYPRKFLLVRNRDSTQMIYPLAVNATMEAAVVGPDDMAYDTQWYLPSSKDTKVTLTITTEGMKDEKKVTWAEA